MKIFFPALLLCSSSLFAQVGWHEYTNTNLRTQAIPDIGGGSPNWTVGCPPNNWQPTGGGMPVFQFHDLCFDMMNNSNGGWFDTKRNRQYIFGGGHNGYIGNEVYYYDLNSGTPTPHAVTNPSVTDITTCPESNADGSPPSMHTYNSMAYIPELDRTFVGPGVSICGRVLVQTWMFNPNGNNPSGNPYWTNMNPSPDIASIVFRSSDGSRVFWNSTRQKIEMEYGNQLMWLEYDPMPGSATYNQWHQLTPYSTYCTGAPGCTGAQSLTWAYDPIRKQGWAFGGSSNTTGQPPGSLVIQYTDFSKGSDYQTHVPVTTGCSTPLMISTGQFPGVVYYPPRRGFVIYPGGGNSMVFFNPSTRECTTHTFTGGPPSSALMAVDGTFGRLGYSPSLKKFFTVIAVDSDIFSFTLDTDPVDGRGHSTTVCLDCDGDGYGVGPDAVSKTDLVITDSVVYGAPQTSGPQWVSGGSSCTVSSTQVVTFTNGGGTGAIGTITINSSGVPVGGVTITSQGTGYTSSPTAGTISSCTGASVFNGGALFSKVTSAGRPFIATDIARWVPVTAGTGFTTGRYQIFGIKPSGSVDTVTINNGGSGYTNGNYVVQITGSPGTGSAVTLFVVGGVITYAKTLPRRFALEPGSGYTSGSTLTTSAFNLAALGPGSGANLSYTVNTGAPYAILAGNAGTLSSTGGSWSMAGCLGPDADDFDATVHSASDVLTKWSTIPGWLNHLGYAATNVWYMAPATASPAGNDTTCAANSASTPCLTWAHVNSLVRPGDAIIMRDKWTGYITAQRSVDAQPGTSGSPYFWLSYPGEQAIFDPKVFANSTFSLVDCPYIVIDNVTLQNGAEIVGGTSDASATFAETESIGGVTITSRVPHRLLRHIHAMGGGGGLAPINGFNALTDLTVEFSVLHDSGKGNQHNLYIGSRNLESAMVAIRNNIAYNAVLNNLHYNGRMYNVEEDNNLVYNAAIANLSHQNGTQHSFIRNNITFGYNGASYDFDAYPGSQASPTNNTTCGTGGNQTCTCPGSTVDPGPHLPGTVCPYGFTDNVIENNTAYGTGVLPCTDDDGQCVVSAPSTLQPVIVVYNSSFVPTINHGSNTFRNNHFINLGQSNAKPQIHISDNVGTTCGSNCLSWAASDTFTNNLFYQTSAAHGTDILLLGNTHYTCSTMVSPTIVASNTGCLNADPLFTSVSSANWDNPALLDFSLTGTSPGLHAGTSQGVFISDAVGAAFNLPTPSLGALELAGFTINEAVLPDSTVGAVYSQSLMSQASGGNSPYGSWTVASGALPTGLSLGSSTAVISGTVGGSPGTFTFAVSATDTTPTTATSGNESLTINAAPSITTASPLASGTIGVAYSQSLAATGGTVPLVWTISAGTLTGSGLTLSSVGVVSGMPTTANVYSFTAKATDGAGVFSTKAFSLTIAGAPQSGMKFTGQVTITGQGGPN